MSVFRKPLFVVLCVFLAGSSVSWGQSDDRPGFTPHWKVGDRWVLEATYRDLKVPGEVWLPPIKWNFVVKSMKNVHRQDCYVLHIYPKNRRMKNQAILYLSTLDLHPMRVIEIFPTPSGVKSEERDIDPFHPQPLFSEDSLIPYDLPLFPLIRTDVQGADGFGAYREPEKKKFDSVSSVSGFKFKFRKSVSQGNKKPERKYADVFGSYKQKGETFQVELTDESTKNSTTQLWQAGLPWAVSSDSTQRKVKLVLPSNPTPLPAPKEGE